MGIGPFATIQSRYEAVDMTIQLVFDNLSILCARGSAAIDPWGFLLPLTPTVWISFLLSLILASVTHFLLEANSGTKTSLPSLFSSTLFEYFQPAIDHGEIIMFSTLCVDVCLYVFLSFYPFLFVYLSVLVKHIFIKKNKIPCNNLKNCYPTLISDLLESE